MATNPHTHILRYVSAEGDVFCMVKGCDYRITSNQLLSNLNGVMATVLNLEPVKDYLDNLTVQNYNLEAENARLREAIGDEMPKLRIARLEAENFRLRAALEKYADHSHWLRSGSEYQAIWYERVGYDVAEKALQGEQP